MYYQAIPIRDLDLDVENPRHGTVRDQVAAFRALATEQGPKLIKLALDIHKHGLNPAHRLIVIAGEEDRFVVVDGNRRLAALRLLADPSMLPDEDLPRDFGERVSTHGNAPLIVDCCVVDSRTDARIWLERTHAGEQGGIGTISWSASAKVRFSPGRPNQASRGIAATDWLRARTSDNTILQKQLLKVEDRITNLGRLVSDPDVRRRLGFSFIDNTLTPVLSEKTVISNLTTVIADLASGRSVTELKSKPLRKKYISRLFPVTKPAPRSRPSVRPTPQQPTPKRPAQPKPPAPSTSSLSLFDNVKSDGLSHRIDIILKEVQRIDVTSFPNASAVLVRCVIDMVVADYMRVKRLMDKGSLLKNIRAVMSSLEVTQNDARYHGIRTSLSSQNSLLGVSNLQQYVHNLDTHPVPMDLVQITRNYSPLIEDIASALKSKTNPG